MDTAAATSTKKPEWAAAPKSIHKPGGTIGEIGNRFTAGNMTSIGGYYAPTGSFFECTGRERKIGASYAAADRRQIASVATGPRYSQMHKLPTSPWLQPAYATRWHTESLPARSDISSAFGNYFYGKTQSSQVKL